MIMERYVRWSKVWHTSMIIHPDRSTKNGNSGDYQE